MRSWSAASRFAFPSASRLARDASRVGASRTRLRNACTSSTAAPADLISSTASPMPGAAAIAPARASSAANAHRRRTSLGRRSESTSTASHTRRVTAVGAVPTMTHRSHLGQKNFTAQPMSSSARWAAGATARKSASSASRSSRNDAKPGEKYPANASSNRDAHNQYARSSEDARASSAFGSVVSVWESGAA